MSLTTIPTKRLFLRPFESTDGPAYSEALSLSLEQAQEFVDKSVAFLAAAPPETLPSSFAITLRAGGQFIGHCHLGPERGDPTHADITFTLSRTYWGQGYATEAVRALLRYGFEQQNLQCLFAECQPENLAAKRVLEKVGMQLTEPISRESSDAAHLRFALQSPD